MYIWKGNFSMGDINPCCPSLISLSKIILDWELFSFSRSAYLDNFRGTMGSVSQLWQTVNKLHLRQIQTRTNHTHHICNLLVVTRKDLRLIELATNHDVNWPKCDSPLTSSDVPIKNSYVYIRICIYDLILGSILIPSCVPDHSFNFYLTFDVLCCMIAYCLFRDKLYSIIFRNVTQPYFPPQARLAFIFLQIID